MRQEQTLHMIVGQWKSPNDSNNRETNDSHDIKKQILKEVRRLCKEFDKRDYSKDIGDNPDIGVENGLIILKGRGRFKNKPYYRTVIPADSFFGLQFISTNSLGQFDIMLLSFEQDLNSNELLLEIDEVFIIPNDEQIIELTFDKVFDDYKKTEGIRKSIILVTK
jgi:hypothetical protein